MRFSVLLTISLLFSLPGMCQGAGKQMPLTSHQTKPDTNHIRWLLDQGKALEKSLPDTAAYFCKKATALAVSLKQQDFLIECMQQHIGMLNNEARFESALLLAQEHIKMADRLKMPSAQLQAYNEAANEYQYLGDYERATEFYLRSLKKAAAIGDTRMQRKINNNLGSIFIGLKDYATGYAYSTRAYFMAKAAKDTITMGNCMVNMGVAELNEKKYQQALQHFDEAQIIGAHIPDMTLVADALSDKGLVYLTINDLRAATASYQEQKRIADRYNLPYEKLYSLFQLAMVEKKKGNLKNAANYASRAIAIGEAIGTADELMEMYDSMAAIKKQIGDFGSALSFKDKYESINDSLRNKEVQTNIEHLNIQYRSAQKDKQIAEQNLNIERNRTALERKNVWIFASLSGLSALFVILMISLRSYRHRQKLHRQQLLTLQKQYELDTLKASTQARDEERDRIAREMHDDIGSALTTILYLCDELKTGYKEGPGSPVHRIADTATSVVDKMNEIVWSMNSEYDSIEDLIAYTRQHCAEFLSAHGLRYQLNQPAFTSSLPLTGEQRRNIYLALKEALHNIVKHASASEVCMSFSVIDNSLVVSVGDNGKGFRQSSAFGNGIKNMRRRMEIIGGRFEINGEQGTQIHLQCPLRATADPI